MWTTILAIITFIIIRFFYDKSKQTSKIALEGGVRIKYAELIEILLNIDPRMKIFQETTDSISLGVTSSGGTTIFYITQTFNKVTVEWVVNNPVFGKHKLEWDFAEYGNQNGMANRIFIDTSVFQEELVKTYGLSDLV